MKRFITKTIFISLPIIILAILMEVLLRNIPNEYLFKKKYLNDHSNDIETLILGSSHSFYGLNPVFFSSKTFNASHISQTLNYDFEILKKYQSKFENLKAVVLPISYFTLTWKLEESSESWRVKNYTIYYEMNDSNLANYSEVCSNRFDVNLKRLVSYYMKNEQTVSCTDLGWGTQYKSENSQDLVESGMTAALRHTKDINGAKYKAILIRNKLILSSVSEWCKSRNIRLVLLLLPAFETYYQGLNSQQLKITIETAESIALENNNCIYLNLLKDTCFDAKDFFDADHLSEIGAEKLSKLINENINKW
jgi:hypothetical protein